MAGWLQGSLKFFDMVIVGVYKILSPTGGVYIGQSWNIDKRFYSHRICKRNNSKISASLLKHGHESHSFEIIHVLPADVDQKTLDIYEQFYLDQYRDIGCKILNLREAGSQGKPSEETRLKQSIARKGKPSPRKGSQHSEESIRKIKEKRSLQKYAGRPPIGNIPWNKGVNTGHQPWNTGLSGVFSHSEETRIKMKQSHIGKHSHKNIDPEKLKKFREASRMANIGRKQSPESLEKRSKSMLGKMHSPETKKVISDKIKAIWATRKSLNIPS